MRLAYSIAVYWFCKTTDKIMSGEMCQTWKYPGGSTEAQLTQSTYAFGLKTSIPRIKDNFSRLVHKSGQIVLNTWWPFFCSNEIIPKHAKSVVLSSFESAQTSSGTVSGHLIFGNDRKSSEIRRKSLELAGTSPEISVMTRWKSHAFDSEKFGRYNIGM